MAEAKHIGEQIASGNVEAASMLNNEAASYGRAVELLRPTGMKLELAAATVAKCFELLGCDKMIEAARHYVRHNTDQVTSRAVRRRGF